MYAFDRLNANAIRFTTENDKTVIKVSESDISSRVNPGYILLCSGANDDIFTVAKSSNLCIVEVKK